MNMSPMTNGGDVFMKTKGARRLMVIEQASVWEPHGAREAGEMLGLSSRHVIRVKTGFARRKLRGSFTGTGCAQHARFAPGKRNETFSASGLAHPDHLRENEIPGGSCLNDAGRQLHAPKRDVPGGAEISRLRSGVPPAGDAGHGGACLAGETTVLEVKRDRQPCGFSLRMFIFERSSEGGVSLEGHEVRTATPETLFDELPRAEVVILPPLVFGRSNLAAAPNLRLVQQWGVGVENIDLAACRRRNVPVLQSPLQGERETWESVRRDGASPSPSSLQAFRREPGESAQGTASRATGEVRSGAHGAWWWDWANLVGTAFANAFSVSV